MDNFTKNTEILKHRLASKLEASKWEYRKLELQYLEAGQHLRSLNQLMWQVPGMAIAITGGLWFGAASIASYTPRVWVMGFAAVVNILTTIILRRIRKILEKYIEHQRNFSNIYPVEDCGKNTVIKCWIAALLAAAIVSIAGAFYPESISKKDLSEKLPTTCNVSVDLPSENGKLTDKNTQMPSSTITSSITDSKQKK